MAELNNPIGNNADDHLSRLLVDQVEEPFYKSLIQNIKDLINEGRKY